jgi:hypothetical protein
MGKSVLVDILKSSCPSSFWVVTVNLNEHVKFLKENHTVYETIEYFLASQNHNGFSENRNSYLRYVYRNVEFYDTQWKNCPTSRRRVG